jgi:hypothetical protein
MDDEVATALGTAADHQLQQRVVSHPVEIVTILIAAADREHARLGHLD